METLTAAGLDAVEWGWNDEVVEDIGRAVVAICRDSVVKFSRNSSLTAPSCVLSVCRALIRASKKAVSEARGIMISFISGSCVLHMNRCRELVTMYTLQSIMTHDMLMTSSEPEAPAPAVSSCSPAPGEGSSCSSGGLSGSSPRLAVETFPRAVTESSGRTELLSSDELTKSLSRGSRRSESALIS